METHLGNSTEDTSAWSDGGLGLDEAVPSRELEEGPKPGETGHRRLQGFWEARWVGNSLLMGVAHLCGGLPLVQRLEGELGVWK